MDFIWILFAFGCGLGVRVFSLPPLIGYLMAGFILNAMGVTPAASLDTLADLGITLMLFTIGLKLDFRSLLKSEIWAGAGLSLGLWIVLTFALFSLVAVLSLASENHLNPGSIALLTFALGFSSTVCVVKLLEESGEMKTRHGQIAIGILVIQDIVAVLFMVAASGHIPSVWSLGLLLLVPLRGWIGKLLEKAGHGELLPLTGFFLALGGYELFVSVGLKGDLGALVAGMLLSTHAKSAELSKSLLGFKDLFLIGFFLSIGFSALPTWSMFLLALGFCLILPLKFAIFYGTFYLFRLRARSSFLASLALTNYSEFGLIVLVIAVEYGWLSQDWLVVLAIAVSLSFAITSTSYRFAHHLYQRYLPFFKRFERPERLAEDKVAQPNGAEILVIGMGRVGKGAYQALCDSSPGLVWGMDADARRIEGQREAGMLVFCGDGEDADLWEAIDHSAIKLILLALPSIDDIINITEQLQAARFKGQIAAIARYEDERETLLASGIGHVFNFYTEAGTGFAEESLSIIANRT